MPLLPLSIFCFITFTGRVTVVHKRTGVGQGDTLCKGGGVQCTGSNKLLSIDQRDKI